jgi:hypothetical protein
VGFLSGAALGSRRRQRCGCGNFAPSSKRALAELVPIEASGLANHAKRLLLSITRHFSSPNKLEKLELNSRSNHGHSADSPEISFMSTEQPP